MAEEEAIHFFFVCNLYTAQRAILLDSIRTITHPSLKVILYGDSNSTPTQNKSIIKFVHDFIKSTRRFF
jgi:hypothetical protein